MRFIPLFCPRIGCPSAYGERAFRWIRRGRYRRQCDGRWIPRFHCSACDRSFSSQTYRSSFRYRKPVLHLALLPLLCSKVTRRQAARILGVNRKTVERRFVRMAQIARDFHRWKLSSSRAQGGISGVFQLDELETFEHHRLLKPVTMSVLIERRSYFVVDLRAGRLASRRPLHRRNEERAIELEALEGRRASDSSACVQRSFRTLAQLLRPGCAVYLQTDRKPTYPVECRKAMPRRRVIHSTESSRTLRNKKNLLFPINHTLAMMRDGMSCLVRRSWGHSKRRTGLQRHAWIWCVYRNYVRGVTNSTRTTPAQSAGVCQAAFTFREAFQWRWPSWMSPSQRHSKGPASGV